MYKGIELGLILTHVTQKPMLRVGERSAGVLGKKQEPRALHRTMPLQHANRLSFRWFPLIED